MDLKKAFDTINHSILLCKMSLYGIKDNALSWFRSYLHNTKKLKYNHTVFSKNELIQCGVLPQGSTLGPLPFLLYIYDFPNISHLLTFVLFADDTNIFVGSTVKNCLGLCVCPRLFLSKPFPLTLSCFMA